MRASFSIILLLALAGAGCGKDATAPKGVAVSVTVQPIGVSAFGLQLEAVATNTGTEPTSYIGGCMRAARLEFRDSGGNQVVVENPCVAALACPGAPVILDPGQSVTYEFTIQGMRWPATDPPTCDGVPLEPGTYTALVVFRYWSGIDRGETAVRQASGTSLVSWPPAN